MKLLFAGTRGEIEARSRWHGRHSVLVVIHRGRRIIIVCGLDWLGKIDQLRPEAIVLTHAHPDHAGGLKNGAPCRVYAMSETWSRLQRIPVAIRSVIKPRKRENILGVDFEAFAVEHSILAPAVGYKIQVGKTFVFYAPDLVSISAKFEALAGVDLYVGDGASITRALVRRRGKAMIGHASIRDQLGWCAEAGIPRAIFTHCGSKIVLGGDAKGRAQIKAIGSELGVDAGLAYDGLELKI